jgi:thiamine biosynthesis lipoprotein
MNAAAVHDPAARVFRHEAMATWFELHLADGDESFARGAAAEAFRLLDQLEGLLSRYREESEISIISRLRDGESFAVHEDVFDCLSQALSVSEATFGAFDLALGREIDRNRRRAATGEDAAVGESVAVAAGERGRLLLDAGGRRVICERAPVPLDLGGIGKGFALDRLAALLAEWGVTSALLAGGGSSVRTLAGAPSTAAHYWSSSLADGSVLWLRDAALGCSGVAVQGRHIIDPRDGRPADGPARVWVLAPTAAAADAFSTAFMILPAADILRICAAEPALAVARQVEADGAVEWLAAPDEARHGARCEVQR